MAGTTSQNGWPYPTSTDLVTNGATAIQSLATAIDTSCAYMFDSYRTSWAPTISGTGWGAGNGTWATYYIRWGKTVHCYAAYTFGSSKSIGTGALTISLPLTMARVTAQIGTARYNLNGTIYYGYVIPASTTTVTMGVHNASATYLTGAGVTSTVPIAAASVQTGDTIYMQFIYEAA